MRFRNLLLPLMIVTTVLALTACAAENTEKETSVMEIETQSEENPCACVPPDGSQAEYHKLTPEEAKARMDGESEIIILDVRTQEEYDEKHIEGAVLLPNEDIGTEMPEQLPDKSAEILVYCRSGRRSKEAAEKLVAMGYYNVYDFGGIIDWPYDTVSE